MTKTHLVHEFEIKISRSDFLADFKKREYHPQNGTKHERMAERKHGWAPPPDAYEIKHGLLKSPLWTPNYFWFCAPKGILRADDIPEYAGFIEFESRYIVPPWRNAYAYWDLEMNEMKSAPRLHRQKAYTENLKEAFIRRLTNIVTNGRGGNFDAIPAKISTKTIEKPQLELF